MDIYARQINAGLNEIGCQSSIFTPRHPLERVHHSRFAMRYLRYFAYPRQVQRHDQVADVQHVIDHGYAHLHSNLGRGLKVVSAHDLIPFLTWQGRIPSEGKVRKPHLNLHSLKYLRDYDRVIAMSQSTARDLIDLLGVCADKISIVPPVIGEHFSHQDPHAVSKYRKQLVGDSEAKIVMISGREHYKNFETSIRVVKRLLNQNVNVVLIKSGLPNPSFDQLIQQEKIADKAKSIYIESHLDLPLLYSAADCLLFPSWYEGFGMPVAEALACGTCVVSSNAASLPEVGGELALTAEPDDVAGLADLVYTCLTDESMKKKVLRRGERWVDQFRTEPVLNRLMKAYNV